MVYVLYIYVCVCVCAYMKRVCMLIKRECVRKCNVLVCGVHRLCMCWVCEFVC